MRGTESVLGLRPAKIIANVLPCVRTIVIQENIFHEHDHDSKHTSP